MSKLNAFVLIMAGACSMSLATSARSADATPAKPQAPVAAEKNPPGDIPDNQLFVTYKSPLGFSIKVPEGWARRESADGVSFADKYNDVQITVVPRASAPTLTGLKMSEVAALEKSSKAVQVSSVKAEALPAGQALVVRYGANSDPNPVTNKAIRVDSARYWFWKAGKLATLTLSAPAGADNADQWLLMARSFTWQ